MSTTEATKYTLRNTTHALGNIINARFAQTIDNYNQLCNSSQVMVSGIDWVQNSALLYGAHSFGITLANVLFNKLVTNTGAVMFGYTALKQNALPALPADLQAAPVSPAALPPLPVFDNIRALDITHAQPVTVGQLSSLTDSYTGFVNQLVQRVPGVTLDKSEFSNGVQSIADQTKAVSEYIASAEEAITRSNVYAQNVQGVLQEVETYSASATNYVTYANVAAPILASATAYMVAAKGLQTVAKTNLANTNGLMPMAKLGALTVLTLANVAKDKVIADLTGLEFSELALNSAAGLLLCSGGYALPVLGLAIMIGQAGYQACAYVAQNPNVVDAQYVQPTCDLFASAMDINLSGISVQHEL